MITIANLNEAEKRVKVRRGQSRRCGKGRDELVEKREIKVTEARTKKLNQIRKRVLISIASGSVLCLIFGREACTSVIQRTQKSFVEIPLEYDFIKIINYFNANPKFKLREIK